MKAPDRYVTISLAPRVRYSSTGFCCVRKRSDELGCSSVRRPGVSLEDLTLHPQRRTFQTVLLFQTCLLMCFIFTVFFSFLWFVIPSPQVDPISCYWDLRWFSWLLVWNLIHIFQVLHIVQWCDFNVSQCYWNCGCNVSSRCFGSRLHPSYSIINDPQITDKFTSYMIRSYWMR